MNGTMDPTVTLINEELTRRYEQALAQLPRLPAGVSEPHLIQVPPTYALASTRLMVVGQQTYGWGDPPYVGSVQLLMAGYASFDLGNGYRRSPLWMAAHKLHRALNPEGPERAFLWSNLVKVDQKGERPTPEVEEMAARLGLLQMEIELTKPDVVIFFTGPDYDDRLKATFPSVRFVDAGRLIHRLEHPHLPTRSFRTYHPKHLRLSRNWSVLTELIALAR